MSYRINEDGPRRRLPVLIAAVPIVLCLASICIVVAQDFNPWRTEDLIDERIDEDAQYALMRMFAGEFYETINASAMLSAIKAKELAGIYQIDRQVPALRARSMGGDYWDVIPDDFDAICWQEPDDELPIIVYRKGVGPIRGRIDKALSDAWNSCGIDPAPPRPYIVTIVKPPPPPPPPPPDLPPLPSTSLIVKVVGDDGPLPGCRVDIFQYTIGGIYSLTTGDDGTVSTDIGAGMVDILIGPVAEPCYDGTHVGTEIEDGSCAAISVRLRPCPNRDTPKPKCDEDEYHEVFNACGLAVLKEAAKCLKDAYLDYVKCAGKINPKDRLLCTTKEFAKFLACKNNLDHKRKIQECTDKANRESDCAFPGPQ